MVIGTFPQWTITVALWNNLFLDNFLHVYDILVMPIASPPTSPLDPFHPISVELLLLSLPVPFPGSWLGLFGDPFSLTRAICVGWVLDWKLNWRYPLVISGRLWRQWIIILFLIYIPSKPFSLAARDSPAPFPQPPKPDCSYANPGQASAAAGLCDCSGCISLRGFLHFAALM